jgi:hypothetical protein
MYDYTLTRNVGVLVEMRLANYTFRLHEVRNLHSSFYQKHNYLYSAADAMLENTICVLLLLDL